VWTKKCERLHRGVELLWLRPNTARSEAITKPNDGGRGTIRGRVCLTEEMLGVVFAMEVASYGSPLVGKTLLLHVIAICLRIGPNHPCLP